MSRCRSCGAEIKWIKMASGKAHPVDPYKRTIIKGEGSEELVTDDGHVIHGRFASMKTARMPPATFRTLRPARTQTSTEGGNTMDDRFRFRTPCTWNEELECTGGFYCDLCEHQPQDDDKLNGKKEPVKIIWQNDYGMIMPYCPTCGEMAYSTERCKFCGQKFIQEEKKPENKKEITGGTLDEDGYITCEVCGSHDMALISHADGADFFDYTYECIGCGARINVRTLLIGGRP